MFKVIWLLRRKSGMTFEQFRHHYENTHAKLGQAYFGHLFLAYRRNYNVSSGVEGISHFNLSDVDCIAEWDMRDEAAFREYLRLGSDPVVGAIFREDSARFLDSGASQMIVCEALDTGPGNGAEAMQLKARDAS